MKSDRANVCTLASALINSQPLSALPRLHFKIPNRKSALPRLHLKIYNQSGCLHFRVWKNPDYLSSLLNLPEADHFCHMLELSNLCSSPFSPAQHNCDRCERWQYCKWYSGVLLKWEFFIKMRAACFAPSFLQKRGVLEWGWLQVGSSHINEKFSL